MLCLGMLAQIPRYSLQIAPLGLRTILRSSSPPLLEAAAVAYADWAVAEIDAPVLEVTLELGRASEGEGEVEIRVDGARLALNGPGITGWADAAAKRAHGVVPAWLAEDPKALADRVLDTLLLFLIARAGRTPVHAAGVMIGDRVAVLAGPSGAGKSTLALRAMERGLRILSDDTLYIQLHPAFRAWGLPRPLHVFPETAPRFSQGTRLRAGKLKLVAPLAPEAARSFADDAVLVVLDRGERLALTPIAPEAALARLGPLEPGFDLLRRESDEALGALARRGAWRLALTGDPGAAIDLLCERLGADADVVGA